MAFMRWMWVVLLAASAGCAAKDGAESARDGGSECPRWMIQTDAAPPVGPCRIPGDTVNVPESGVCDPVACQAWTNYGQHGDGGTGAILCAAACLRACDGDPAGEKLNAEEAWTNWGVRCAY